MTVIGFFARGRLFLSSGDLEVEIEVEPAEMMSVRRLVQTGLESRGCQVLWLN